INTGDIIIDGEDIFGDGVNVASRLEGIADPGGICVPRKIFHEIRNKLDVGYEFLGERKVKNIETAIPVYKILLEPDAAETAIGEGRQSRPRWQLGAVAALVVAVITTAGIAWWQPWVTRVERASITRMKFPLPNKPSVAVLPFDNLSDNPEQGFLADGITEDIITNLASVSDLFVIARKSTFYYKGKQVKVRQVAEDLGVRHVVQGSLRRADDTIRVTAQMIDVLSGEHIWAARYDRDLVDIFKVQDEIAKTIALKLVTNLNWTVGGKQRTRNIEAYHLTLKSRAERLGRLNSEANERSRQLAIRAIELDPNYASAHAELAMTYHNDYALPWGSHRKEMLDRSFASARKAVALDNTDPYAHRALGFALMYMGNQERAIAAFDKAVSLNPSNAYFLFLSAAPFLRIGNADEVIKRVQAAKRLNPYHFFLYPHWIGLSLYSKRRYAEAAAEFEKARRLNPRFGGARFLLAATYAQLGNATEASVEVEWILNRHPDFRISTYRF
ncbi:MAG: tetratricopeptide repeat protein, partial [Desulfobulbia bacterium]